MMHHEDVRITAIVSIVLIIFLVLLVLVMSGCRWAGTEHMDKLVPGPKTPAARVAEAVRSTNWLVTVAILGVAVSIAAVISGSRGAIGPLVGSVIMLGLTLMVNRYAEVVAFISLVCVVGGMGFLVYNTVVRKRAIKELVKAPNKFHPLSKTTEKVISKVVGIK
jgi:Na+-transporting methylmalonyl-CoA/oxaloacetate decarboxylase gamma subunit